MKWRMLLFLIAVTTLIGCASVTSPARQHALEANKEYWIDYDATRRGAVVIPADAKVKMCAEPSPDAALNLVTKLGAALERSAGEKGEISSEFSASVVKLAERNQMVMFLRESLYRLCEQSLNQQFSQEAILKSYDRVIEAALEMAKADQERAKEAAAKAVKSLTPDQVRALQ